MDSLGLQVLIHKGERNASASVAIEVLIDEPPPCAIAALTKVIFVLFCEECELLGFF